MAEFEELKLSVTLSDNASLGLQRIRTEIGALTGIAQGMTTTVNQASTGLTQLAGAAQKATPAMRAANLEMRALGRAGSEMGAGVSQMLMSAQGGIGALPQLAVGLHQAAQGMGAANTAMVALGASSRVAVLGIAGLAIGVGALAAGVLAYGVSVLRFAREMDELNKSARQVGVSFADLKSAQDQAKAFGHAAETITRMYQGIQDAQFNLHQNNSALRQKLLEQGVNADWVNQLTGMDPTKARNTIVAYARQLEKESLASGFAKNVARARANSFLGEFGIGKEQLDMPDLKPPSEKTKRELKEIARLSNEVAIIWGDIGRKWDLITLPILKAGLPLVRDSLAWIDNKIDEIKAVIDLINSYVPWSKDKDSSEEKPPAQEAPPGQYGPRATQPPPFLPHVQRQSFDGAANDNRSLFRNASLADGIDRSAEQTEKLTEQLERLNSYFDRTEGGGGFMNASLTTGGSRGGGGYGSGGGGTGSGGGWGGGGYTSLPPGGGGGGAPGGGGGATGGGAPGSGGGGAAPETTTGAGGPAPGAGGSAYLAKQREQLFKEYDSWTPEQKRTLSLVMQRESKDALESLANRSIGQKQSLWKGLSSGQYSTFRQAQSDAARGLGSVQTADKLAAPVRGGSDVLEGRSDQGMWTDPGHRAMHAPGAAPGTGINELGRARRLKYINGEWYSDKVSIPLSQVKADREAKAAYDAQQQTASNSGVPVPPGVQAQPGTSAPVLPPELGGPTAGQKQVLGSGRVEGLDETGRNRLSGDMSIMRGVDPTLVKYAVAGAKYLPEGYTLRPVSGFRGGRSQSYHAKSAATDWQIYRPDGTPIPHKGDDHSGLYTLWARGAYTEAMKENPAAAKQMGWGGAFETSAGSGTPDIMHLDWGGQRGRLRPGNILSNLGTLSQEEQTAALGRAGLSREALTADKAKVTTDGKLNATVTTSPDVKAKVDVQGSGAFKKTETERSTGPSVSETAKQYMATN